MKKNKSYYFIVPLQVYPFDVMISVDESDHTLLTRLIKYGNKKEDCYELMCMSESVLARTMILPSGQTVIRIKKQKSNIEMTALMSHEIFHAVTFILDRLGMKLELLISDEAYAYLIQYLTKEIFKRIKP
jgi:hypothetical protein